MSLGAYLAPVSNALPDELVTVTPGTVAINLNCSYTMPSLGVKETVWYAAQTLLPLAVVNASTLGTILWYDYPTMKMFMHAIITR